jgi:4-amino-4-deoxy-L-arabinose transferase-like glycosyltransferase
MWALLGRGTTAASVAPRLLHRAASLPMWVILALAIVARLIAGVAFSAESTDTYEFGHLATNITNGDGYSYTPANEERVLPLAEADQATRWLPSAYMPPGYTSVAVVGAWVGGDSHLATVWVIRLCNLGLAAATCLLVLALTRRLVGSEPAARLAVLGFALYPPAVYVATQVSAANFYIPVQLAVLVTLLVAQRRASWTPWLAAGVALGSLTLLRAEALPAIVLAGGWLAWSGHQSSPPGRRGRLLAGFLLVAAALPGGWLVRNSLVFGEPTASIATSGGWNLWIGNHPGASGSQKDFEVPAELRAELGSLPPTDDYELRADALLRREAIDNIVADPLGTVALDLKKLALLVGADVYDRRSLNPIYLAAWAVVAVLGWLGLRRWWRAREADERPTRVLVAGFLAINVAIPVVFFALARYKLPIEVMALVFAGNSLAVWCSRQVTTMSPSLASTVTVEPSVTSPSSSSMASGSATSRWMTRLRGRAPKASS